MVHFSVIRIPSFHRARAHEKRQAAACANPAFYTAPKSGDSINANTALLVSWDTSSSYASCFKEDQIKIALTSPTQGHIKDFKPIAFSSGRYEIKLDPHWWNSTATIDMRTTIMGYSSRDFLGEVSSGPEFTVNYDGKDNSTASPDSIFNTKGGVAQNGGIPRGHVAAAVLVPIIVIFVAVFGYIKFTRHRAQQKHKRFSQAVDARMSRISGDWASMSAKGANAAIRQSTATGTAMRMSRVFAQEMQVDMRHSGDRVSMVGRPSHDTNWSRTSRINFAPDTNTSKERLSTYSQNRTSTYSTSRASRAFHVGIAAPPIPSPPAQAHINENDLYEEDEAMSPRQAQGAIALSNDDISNIDIAPALRLMRTTNNPAVKSTDDLLLTPTPTSAAFSSAPTSPAPLLPNNPLSPLGMMPMQTHNAIYMNPDDLLRQYASARVRGARSPTIPNAIYASNAPPSPSQPQYTAAGMRNLTGDPNLGRSDKA